MFKLKQMFAVLLLSSACSLSGASLAADKAAPAPSVSAAPASAPVVSAVPAVSAAPGMVNLNTADVVTLARELSGVGDIKARAIVDYRASHGAFTSVDQLLEVQGIGMGILEKNRNKLTLN